MSEALNWLRFVQTFETQEREKEGCRCLIRICLDKVKLDLPFFEHICIPVKRYEDYFSSSYVLHKMFFCIGL
jgi:hypothetical protein